MNPWHDLNPGSEAPSVVLAFNEISQKSSCKYELHKESGLLFLDRVLSSAVFYPQNYGFIPRTYCEDKDPLDIMILCQHPIQPGALVNCRPVGALKMVDGGEEDDKILAVCEGDPVFKHIDNLSQVNPHTLKEIEQFFKTYKNLENKTVHISGWQDRQGAHALISQSFRLYEDLRKTLHVVS
jgi:inorganic pyrophosphatase